MNASESALTGAATRRRSSALLWVCSACLIILMLVSLTLGRYPVSLSEVIRIVFTTWPFGATGEGSDIGWVTVELVRMPRILAVTLSGMGLGLAGAAIQGVLRNPLVGPDTCGVSAGASFGAVLAILLGLSSFGILLLAFAFGLLALPIAFSLAAPVSRGGVIALVLAGLVVSTFFASAVGLVQYIADPHGKLPTITYWLLGSFADADYSKTAILGAVTLVAGTVLMALRWRINVLSLGDADAGSLGVNVQGLRWTIIALLSLIVAAQTSVGGGVGWVGLVIPHFARMLVGPDHARLLPVSALLGGIYLLAMDNIARSVGPDEIPIGLLTAFVGAPVFAWLLKRQQEKGWTHE